MIVVVILDLVVVSVVVVVVVVAVYFSSIIENKNIKYYTLNPLCECYKRIRRSLFIVDSLFRTLFLNSDTRIRYLLNLCFLEIKIL